MTQPIKAILIGAGQRGMDAYAPYALQHPAEIKFVAVAEPDPERRARFAAKHNISSDNQFESWEPLLEKDRLGEAALVCTQDQMHTAPTIAALNAGYDVLLEKPMAPTLAECQLLVKTAEENGRQFHICHVLRYTEHFQKMKAVIDSGILGDIINVSHRENVAWWHMAHSYVRGHWGNQALSAPIILAKCCHDLDILVWLLNDRSETLSSVGNLIHYRPENAPEGAAKRCLDGCAVAGTCRYYAPFIYIDHTPLWRSIVDSGEGFVKWATKTYLRNPGLVNAFSKIIPDLKTLTDYRGWPSSAVTNDPTPANLMAALKEGPYGRCVYHCNNDVVDHQVVSMQFEHGTSVTLTMHGHSHLEGRTTRIEGSNATLKSEFLHGGSWIEVNEHRSDRCTRYITSTALRSGHGGGDYHLMAGFVRALRENDGSRALTTARNSLESHLMAFAAEDSRLGNKTITMEDYRE
jgi:predicted dehydrogenase